MPPPLPVSGPTGVSAPEQLPLPTPAADTGAAWQQQLVQQEAGSDAAPPLPPDVDIDMEPAAPPQQPPLPG